MNPARRAGAGHVDITSREPSTNCGASGLLPTGPCGGRESRAWQPSSMEYFSRPFPPSTHPPNSRPGACTHADTHTHPLSSPRQKNGVISDAPCITNSQGESQKTDVSRGGAETDRQAGGRPCTAAAPLAVGGWHQTPGRTRQNEGGGRTACGTGDAEGVIKGVTLARPGREGGASSGASEASRLLSSHVCAGARGDEGRRPGSGGAREGAGRALGGR